MSWLESLWYPADRSGLSSTLLLPISWAYRAGLRRAARAQPVSVGRPVISIGNLTVGGAGKTPLIIDLAQALGRAGKRVAVVARGYGRQSRGVVVASVAGQKPLAAAQVGDEPALVARRCRQAAVVVGEDRVAAAFEAIRVFDPDIILCDDAFQHRRLHRDLDVLAVHAQRGFGNGRLLPAGPMREPIAALARARLVVFTHAQGVSAPELRERHSLPAETTVLACDFVPAGLVTMGLSAYQSQPEGPVLAVCAVAHPRGFLSTCRQAGLTLVDAMSFRDHHFFTMSDLARIEARARHLHATAIVMTEKDLVRWPQPDLAVPVLGLRVETSWPGPSLAQWIEEHGDGVA